MAIFIRLKPRKIAQKKPSHEQVVAWQHLWSIVSDSYARYWLSHYCKKVHTTTTYHFVTYSESIANELIANLGLTTDLYVII